MKFTLAAATAALVSANWAVLASAYTTPVGDAPSGNPIAKPGLGDIVPKGEPYTITWTPTSSGTVTLILLRGPGENVVPLEPIAENIPNTGTYEWTPGSSLEPDTTRYGIQLIQDSDGAYQYSTQFGIGESAAGESHVSGTPTDSIEQAAVTDSHSASTTHSSYGTDAAATATTTEASTESGTTLTVEHTQTVCTICSHDNATTTTASSTSSSSYVSDTTTTTSSSVPSVTTHSSSSTTAHTSTLHTSVVTTSSTPSTRLPSSSSSAPSNASSTPLPPANSAAGQLAVSFGSAMIMMGVASLVMTVSWI